MERARSHQRLFSALAFGLLALVAELAGRSVTHRVDLGSHVATPSYAHADYYPILLVVVKVGIALLLARLLWRVMKARSTEAAGLRLLGGRAHLPRLRFQLSPRLWLAFFLLTSVIFLVQADAESAEVGRWPLLAPWLHSSALPAFAVISVVCRARVERRAQLARRLRGARPRDRRPRPAAGRPRTAARSAAPARSPRPAPRASSGSRSRAARLR